MENCRTGGATIARWIRNERVWRKDRAQNDAICPIIFRLSNCRTTGVKIVLVSFSDSSADKDKSGIRVAQYLTELPSKEVLLRQLQKSLAVAKDLHTDRWPGHNREAKQAHRRVSGGQSRSKCAARVRRANIEIIVWAMRNKNSLKPR